MDLASAGGFFLFMTVAFLISVIYTFGFRALLPQRRPKGPNYRSNRPR